MYIFIFYLSYFDMEKLLHYIKILQIWLRITDHRNNYTYLSTCIIVSMFHISLLYVIKWTGIKPSFIKRIIIITYFQNKDKDKGIFYKRLRFTRCHFSTNRGTFKRFNSLECLTFNKCLMCLCVAFFQLNCSMVLQ